MSKYETVLYWSNDEETFEEDTFSLTSLSESSLAEDWNSPEENDAWAHVQKGHSIA